MPIYEYRCSSCGHQQEFMQKVSDPQLTVCTRCNKPSFTKMVTAAGFQLKGSGWYATDFKSKAAAGAKPGGEAGAGDGTQKGAEAPKKGDSGEGSTKAACGAGACPACQ